MKNFQIVLLSNLLILFMGCNGFVKTGVDQASATINVSKMKEVFICEYIPNDRQIEIGSDKYRIDEAWVEYRWSYINAEDIEIEKDFRTFYIRAFNLQTKEYDFEYSPEDNFFSNFEVVKPLELKNKRVGYKGTKLSLLLEINESIPEKVEVKFKGKTDTKTIVFTKLK